MLYPENKKDKLDEKLFKTPGSEYRGAPFWAWNCKLDRELLLREIGYLKDMGFGGFHIHSRSGMATEYLGSEFMDLVRSCNEKAKENKMLCWLYDEDRWPSGFAGGYVTKDKKYRSRFLVFTTKSYEDVETNSSGYDSSARAQRSSDRRLLARYEVKLEDGCLGYYKRLDGGEEAEKGCNLWYAYLEIAGDSPWFNNQAYVNTLDKNAIDKFIEVTHQKYYEEFKDDFGKSMPAIFTDEPQFSRKESFGYADEQREITLPFTDDFDDTYTAAYGESILDYLPELFWELPGGKVSRARYRYHDHICERFASAFADNIGTWCKSHNIMLTGHMMEESTLSSQTGALGEAMRSYRSFQLPGIDMLCDGREYSTAKQAESASHQYGCPGVLSEIYGVTNWDFDFRGHKLAGDWQAALGVTVRVPHLFWVSMEGEAKRDYPASIGYQSPWYREYPLIEDHFARLNTALTRGKAHVRVGVIHPIESYWLHWGPKEQTAMIRDEMEKNFSNIIEWLLFGLIDFDFISESLLPSQSKAEAVSPMRVGKMAYDVIVVPNCETLRSTTLERLKAFQCAGGKVIFAGEPPRLVDAAESDSAMEFAKRCMVIPFTRARLLNAFEDFRDIEIRKEDGAYSDNLIYQMRDDGDRRWLFICHVNKMKNPDIASKEKISIRIKGRYKPVIYDTMTGSIYPCRGSIKEGRTCIEHEFYQHDSLLLCLEEGEPDNIKAAVEKIADVKSVKYIKDPVPVTLSEPNVLLLDMAEYSFDGGEWNDREEILRIDNEFRRKLGYRLRMNAMAQPWVSTDDEKIEHMLSLKFDIESEIEVEKPYLALENPEGTEILVNGAKVDSKVDGWFVDESIKKVKLPSLPCGHSEIILNIKFAGKTNVEWCYLLGNFGVEVKGSHSKITKPVIELAFGDWVNQGLPFYAGNVTYHCLFNSNGGELMLEAGQFRNPLLSVSMDGEDKGRIAFAPYTLDLGLVGKGRHVIDITAFGNRINTFGTVHNCDNTAGWAGPDAWRTEGTSWSYEYRLKPTGVLTAPKLYKFFKK